MARYIDAELAKAEFTGNFQDRYLTAHIKALIDSTPTADVQPVVHGEWLQVDNTKCRCSHCDVITMIAQYPNGDKNYCPNCGAKMEVQP